MSGLRGADVRVEYRLDGTLAVRFNERYLPVKECAPAERKAEVRVPAKPEKERSTGERSNDWNKNFDLKKGPKIWQAAQASGHKKR